MTPSEVDKLYESIAGSLLMAIGALLAHALDASYALIGAWVVLWIAFDVCWALIRSGRRNV